MYASRSRRTSGSAFSETMRDALVWCTNTVHKPESTSERRTMACTASVMSSNARPRVCRRRFSLWQRTATLLLELGLPSIVRHPVDPFARALEVELDASLLGGGGVPLAEAVAAKPGQVHQVDVLDVGPLLEVGDQAAERRGFHLGALRIVGNGGFAHAVTPAGWPKNTPLTRLRGSRRIVRTVKSSRTRSKLSRG